MDKPLKDLLLAGIDNFVGFSKADSGHQVHKLHVTEGSGT